MTACCIPPLNVTTLSTTPTNVPGVRCGSSNNWIVNTHGRAGTCGGYSRLLFYALVYLLTNAVSSVAAPLQLSVATMLKTSIFPYFGSSQKREDGVNLFSLSRARAGGRGALFPFSFLAPKRLASTTPCFPLGTVEAVHTTEECDKSHPPTTPFLWGL